MSLFNCPICKNNLYIENKAYKCQQGHSFDIAKENYVNLLPANQKNSLNPGDDKKMVQARFNFLSKGYYSSLAEELSKIAQKYAKSSILDCGCGEGYYTNKIHSSLLNQGKDIHTVGIDISKWAVRLASKNSTGARYAVGSAFHLPISDNSIDFLINCFSPLCLEEFHRVLKKDGCFVYVVPAPKHLWELKECVYDNAYENEEKIEVYEGFTHVAKIISEDKIFIEENQIIKDLFMMTPYAWKTPKKSLEKLDKITDLNLTIGFHLHIYIKIN